MNKYSEKSDPTLVDLTLLGDDSTFEELVVRHQKRTLGTAYKVTSNRWSAEDAAQDWTRSSRRSALENHERFGAWVCSIAKDHTVSLVHRYATRAPRLTSVSVSRTGLNRRTGAQKTRLSARQSIS